MARGAATAPQGAQQGGAGAWPFATHHTTTVEHACTALACCSRVQLGWGDEPALASWKRISGLKH